MDSLDNPHMNVIPRGKQRRMKDGWWGGKTQKTVDSAGVAKGLCCVRETKSGYVMQGMNADKMCEILAVIRTFKYKKWSAI